MRMENLSHLSWYADWPMLSTRELTPHLLVGQCSGNQI
jgi:hypothetical protein